jgi:hypothetical protein
MEQEKTSILCLPKTPNLSQSGSLSMVGLQYLRVQLPDHMSRNAPPREDDDDGNDYDETFDVASVLQEALDLSDRARSHHAR